MLSSDCHPIIVSNDSQVTFSLSAWVQVVHFYSAPVVQDGAALDSRRQLETPLRPEANRTLDTLEAVPVYERSSSRSEYHSCARRLKMSQDVLLR